MTTCPRCGSEYVMQFPWGAMCCAQGCAHRWPAPDTQGLTDEERERNGMLEDLRNTAHRIANVLGVTMNRHVTWDSLIHTIAQVVRERDDLVSWKNRHMVKDGSGGYTEGRECRGGG